MRWTTTSILLTRSLDNGARVLLGPAGWSSHTTVRDSYASLALRSPTRRIAPNDLTTDKGGERRLDVIEFLQVVNAIGGDPVRIVKALRTD